MTLNSMRRFAETDKTTVSFLQDRQVRQHNIHGMGAKRLKTPR